MVPILASLLLPCFQLPHGHLLPAATLPLTSSLVPLMGLDKSLLDDIQKYEASVRESAGLLEPQSIGFEFESLLDVVAGGVSVFVGLRALQVLSRVKREQEELRARAEAESPPLADAQLSRRSLLSSLAAGLIGYNMGEALVSSMAERSTTGRYPEMDKEVSSNKATMQSEQQSVQRVVAARPPNAKMVPAQAQPAPSTPASTPASTRASPPPAPPTSVGGLEGGLDGVGGPNNVAPSNRPSPPTLKSMGGLKGAGGLTSAEALLGAVGLAAISQVIVSKRANGKLSLPLTSRHDLPIATIVTIYYSHHRHHTCL